MPRIAVKRPARLLPIALVGVLLVGAAAAGRSRQSPGAPQRPDNRPVLAPDLPAPRPDPTGSTVQGLVEHLQLHPRDREARYRLAHLYFQSFDYTHSLEELRILEQQDPHDPGVPLRRA